MKTSISIINGSKASSQIFQRNLPSISGLRQYMENPDGKNFENFDADDSGEKFWKQSSNAYDYH